MIAADRLLVVHQLTTTAVDVVIYNLLMTMSVFYYVRLQNRAFRLVVLSLYALLV